MFEYLWGACVHLICGGVGLAVLVEVPPKFRSRGKVRLEVGVMLKGRCGWNSVGMTNWQPLFAKRLPVECVPDVLALQFAAKFDFCLSGHKIVLPFDVPALPSIVLVQIDSRTDDLTVCVL
jgi:hypothetical protein